MLQIDQTHEKKNALPTVHNFLFLGCSLAGFGIGKLFNKSCEGLCIGGGVGLILLGFSSLRIIKRLLAFNKEL